MASINLKVKSDFDQASKDLKKFGTITESEAKKVKKFQDSFKGESIDKFIDKNRRLGVAYKANKSTTQSIIAQQKALEKQSISLIKKGLDPQDKAIEELNKEYNRLQKEYDQTIQKSKAMEKASKNATVALKAIGIAAVAVGVAVLKSTTEIAKMGDNLAKTSRKIGISSDSLQELSFAAERAGLPANNLSGLFQKLNRNIGDLQAGTGTLTTFLNKTDTALKDQLVTTGDSEEAFNLLIDAIAKAPTQFEKAALSQAAFGRAGQDLILFANEGAEGIQKLRDEAKRYGLISEDVAKQSEDFVDAQRNIAQAFIGVRSELAGKLLPTMTDSINMIADFIAEGDNLKDTLETTGIIIGSVAAGLAVFTVATKGALAISTLAKAFKALNLVMAANPAVFVTASIVTLTGVTLGLINAQTGLIDNFKESKRIQDAFKDGTVQLTDKLSVVGRQITENSVEIDKLEDMYSRATDEKFKKKWLDQLKVLYEQNQVSRRIEASIRNEIKAKQDKIDKEVEEARLIQEKIDKEKESARVLAQAYTDQNEAVDAILKAQRSEIEQIDEQIASITELTLVDSVFRDNQLKAVKVLQDKKADVIKKELEEQEKLALEIKKLGDQKVKDAEEAAKKQQEQAKSNAQQIISLTEKSFRIIDSIIQESYGKATEGAGQMLAEIGEATGSVQLQIAGAAVEMMGSVINAWEIASDDVKEITSNLAAETASILEQNQRDWLERSKDNRIAAFQEEESLALKAFQDTLSAQEVARLKTDGILEESTVERLKREKEAALGAGDDILAGQLANELAIAKIKKESLDGQSAAEREYKNAIAQMDYDLAVASIQTKISELRADKAQARAELWWNPGQKAKVTKSYNEAINSVASVTIPPPPTAQTGTPLGGFKVPENMGNSRADSVSMGGLNVSGGENVTVTPRGEGGQSQNIIVQIGRDTIFDVMNDGIESGDIRITTDNIQSA